MAKTMPPAVTAPKLVYGRAEAADALGICLTTIDSLIASKALRASRVGRRVVIRLADIEAMLDQNAA